MVSGWRCIWSWILGWVWVRHLRHSTAPISVKNVNVSDSLRSVSILASMVRGRRRRRNRSWILGWVRTAALTAPISVENVNVSDSLRSVSVSYYGVFVLACTSDFLRCRCQQCKREGDSIARDTTKLRKCQLKLLITSTCLLYMLGWRNI